MSKMSDLQITIEETMETICDKFCKFSGTGTNGECPFDKLVEEAGLK